MRVSEASRWYSQKSLSLSIEGDRVEEAPPLSLQTQPACVAVFQFILQKRDSWEDENVCRQPYTFSWFVHSFVFSIGALHVFRNEKDGAWKPRPMDCPLVEGMSAELRSTTFLWPDPPGSCYFLYIELPIGKLSHCRLHAFPSRRASSRSDLG